MKYIFGLAMSIFHPSFQFFGLHLVYGRSQTRFQKKKFFSILFSHASDKKNFLPKPNQQFQNFKHFFLLPKNFLASIFFSFFLPSLHFILVHTTFLTGVTVVYSVGPSFVQVFVYLSCFKHSPSDWQTERQTVKMRDRNGGRDGHTNRQIERLSVSGRRTDRKKNRQTNR